MVPLEIYCLFKSSTSSNVQKMEPLNSLNQYNSTE